MVQLTVNRYFILPDGAGGYGGVLPWLVQVHGSRSGKTLMLAF